MGLFGGKNSFVNKPLGKNSDASKVVTAVMAPARALVDATQDVAKGDFDSAKNRTIGAFGYMATGGQIWNSSSSLKKTMGQTGFTDQFIQMDNYNQKLMGGKNLTWNEQKGYAGGLMENAAYAGAAYGASTFFPSSSSSVGYGSQSSYLGANTSFTGASASSSAPSYLSGASSASTSSGSYLGASTSFGSATASTSSSSWLSDLGKGALDFGKDIGKTFITASIMNAGKSQATPYGNSSEVMALPYPASDGSGYGSDYLGDGSLFGKPIEPKMLAAVALAVGIGYLVLKKQLA
jgi:hypothetical protein